MMKKFSMILLVVTILAVCLVGATAFASSLVETEENIYIGEYAHDNQNESDRNVVIVYGTASTDEQAGITERGIVLSDGTEYRYYRAWRWDAETGKFGVAIIRKTVEKGEYTARAYAKVGGTYDEENKIVLNYTSIDVGEEVSLNFDATLTQTETDITVTEANSVDLKELITLSGTTYEDLTYTAEAAEGDYVQVSITDGVVSYVTGCGTVTITAKHKLSGEYVEFTAEVWKDKVAVSNADEFKAAAKKGKYVYTYLTNDIEVWNEYAPKTDCFETNWSGVLDGNGYTMRYNHDYDGEGWTGFFYMVEESGVIRNTVFEIDAHLHGQYQSVFAHEMRGLIENCYFKINAQQTASSNGMGIESFSRYFRYGGKIKNSIIESLVAFPISIDADKTATLEDVAWIVPSFATNYVGGIWKNLFESEQMINFCYYTSFANFLAGTGKSVDGWEEYINDKGNTAKRYVTSDLTSAQVLGDAWTVDATNGVSFNDKVVRPATYADLTNVVTAKTGSIVFTEAGQTEQIKMMFNGEYNEMFSFSSSATGVATVGSTNGVVTAVAPGNTVITATHLFSGKTTTIPVTFASKVIEVNNAEELTALTQSKITELGATSQSTVVIKLANNISLKKEDMPYYISSGVKYYSVLPYGEYSGATKETANSTHAFVGVLDGNGYTLDIEFNGEANEAFHGISTKLNKFALVRNLVYKPIINIEMNGTSISALTREMVSGSYVDNVFCDSIINQKISASGSELRAFVIGTFKGLVRQTIIRTRTYTLGSAATNTINTTGYGYFEQVATVNMHARFATNGNANRNIYPAANIREAGYYSNIEQLINGEGRKVTSEKLNDTSVAQATAWDGSGKSYWHTDVEEAQIIGEFTFDKEAGTISMTVNGVERIVYTKPTAVTVTIEAISSSAVVKGTTYVVGKIDGGSSDRIVYASEKPAIATVSSDGTVTGVAAGTAKIYAIDTVTGASKSITITITAA